MDLLTKGSLYLMAKHICLTISDCDKRYNLHEPLLALMVKDGSNRVELSPKARRALEIESVLQRISMKDLASDLILKGISQKTLELLDEESNM